MNDPRSNQINGTVTFKGAPVPYGDIRFIPQSGPAGYATIVNGKFDTAVEGGKGVVLGKHRVVINGFDGVAKPDAELPHGEPLFPEFQAEADIAAGGSTHDFDVVIQKQQVRPSDGV
ncbi:MAG: hypothetical protein R3C05_17380 [Pirellulaceae bacterium]